MPLTVLLKLLDLLIWILRILLFLLQQHTDL